MLRVDINGLESMAWHPEAVNSVQERVAFVTADNAELKPPNIVDWFNITDQEVIDLWKYLLVVKRDVREIGHAELHTQLNADNKFTTHLRVMRTYLAELLKIDAFSKFLSQTHLTPNFMIVLILLHDYGRFVFNGPFSLLSVDKLSDEVLKENFPTFPREYVHSIMMIIRDDFADAEIDQMQVPDLVALTLKVLDTMGKEDFDSHKLRNMRTFFAEDGDYQDWVNRQENNGRLPFIADGEKRIEAKVYAANDIRLTKLGARILEKLTGQTFEQIQSSVQQRWYEKTSRPA